MALARLQPLSKAKRYGILLLCELGDGKQLLPSADAARQHYWALHPAGAVGPAARARGAPCGVRAAAPAPTWPSYTQQVHRIKFSSADEAEGRVFALAGSIFSLPGTAQPGTSSAW